MEDTTDLKQPPTRRPLEPLVGRSCYGLLSSLFCLVTRRHSAIREPDPAPLTVEEYGEAELCRRLLWAAKDLRYLIAIQPEGTVVAHGKDVKTQFTYQESLRVIGLAEHVSFGKC